MMTTVIFDFDGTIINTNTLIEEGLNFFAHRYRGYRLSKEELDHLTGKPLETQLSYIHFEKAPIMLEQFRIWYAHNHNQKVAAFPGMIRLIQRLYQKGYPLAIVTNNGKEALHMGLAHLDIRKYFQMIISREDVAETKPSPEGLTKVLNAFKCPKEAAIFIGDTGSDVLAAKAAGVTSVLVGWSSLSQEAQNILEPDYIAVSTIELDQLIERFSEKIA